MELQPIDKTPFPSERNTGVPSLENVGLARRHHAKRFIHIAPRIKGASVQNRLDSFNDLETATDSELESSFKDSLVGSTNYSFNMEVQPIGKTLFPSERNTGVPSLENVGVARRYQAKRFFEIAPRIKGASVHDGSDLFYDSATTMDLESDFSLKDKSFYRRHSTIEIPTHTYSSLMETIDETSFGKCASRERVESLDSQYECVKRVCMQADESVGTMNLRLLGLNLGGLNLSSTPINGILNAIRDFISSLSFGVETGKRAIAFFSKCITFIVSGCNPKVGFTCFLDFLLTCGLDSDTFQNLYSYLYDHLCNLLNSDFFSMFSSNTIQMQGEFDYTSLASILVSVISLVMIGQIPKQTFFSSFLGNANSVGRACIGLTSMSACMVKVFEYCYERFCMYYYGVPTNMMDAEYFADGIQDYYRDVQDVLDISKQRNVNIQTDRLYCEEVNRLYQKGLELISTLANYPTQRELSFSIKIYHDQISRLYSRVVNSGVFGNGGRLEPLLVWLYGPSGVGKSHVTYPLSIDILKEEGCAQDFETKIYTRRVEQEFWDGYYNQPIVIYDDAFQIVDSESRPNPEFIEVIRTQNIATYPLHMAHLEDKATTRFTSKAVICTSNSNHYSVNSLTCPSAFYRRFDVVAEVTCKPQFGKQMQKTIALDTSKLTGDFVSDLSVYNFKCNGKDMSYSEFKDVVVSAYRNKIANASKFKSDLHRYAEMQGEDDMSRSEIVEHLENHASQYLELDGIGAEYRQDLEGMTFKDKSTFYLKRMYATVRFHIGNQWEKLNLTSTLTSFREFVKNAYEKMASYVSLKSIAMLAIGAFSLFGMTKVASYVAEHITGSQCSSPCQSCKSERRSAESRSDVVKAPRKILSESYPEKTNVSSRIAVESTPTTVVGESRPEKTNSSSRVAVESTPDPILAESRPEIVRTSNRVKVESYSDPNMIEIINSKIIQNSFYVNVEGEGYSGIKVRGIFLGGRNFLTVAHVGLTPGKFIKLKNARHSFTFPVDNCIITYLNYKDGRSKDVVVVTLPRECPAFPNIAKHFVRKDDMAKFRSVACSLVSCGVLEQKNTEYPYVSIHSSEAVAKHIVGQPIEYGPADSPFVQREYYEYNLNTAKGFCGSVLLAQNPTLGRKILGLHVAGDVGHGYATVVLGEDLDNMCGVTMQGEIPEPEEFGTVTPTGSFVSLGKAPFRACGPSKTQLRHSPLYNTLEPTTVAPARLRPFKKDDVLIDPLAKGLEKCGQQYPSIDLDLLKQCKEAYLANISPNPKSGIKRVLTHAEAIRGIEGCPYISGMNRKSSPGYPWRFFTNKAGKYQWLGEGEEYDTTNSALKEACDRLEENAGNGKRSSVVWIDTLKDEKRPHEKVADGKTRVFAAGPMDYCLVFRKYFLAYCSGIQEDFSKHECCVGINPYSFDWTVLANKLSSKGRRVLAGDFKNFDGTLHPDFMWAICDCVNEWYDDGNDTLRETLFSELVNSVHLYGDDLYAWTHSNPSGNPFTAILNSQVLSLKFRYVFSQITGLHPRWFDAYVALCTYGDDHVLNVAEDIASTFTFDAIVSAFADLGMTLTREDKIEVQVNDFRRLGEVTFLKRMFRFDESLGEYLAPLCLDSIREQMYWVKGDLDHDELTRDNVLGSIRELSLYEEKVFKKKTKEIVDVCKEHMNWKPPIFDRLYYINDMRDL